MSTPYTVQSGDWLQKIAEEHGFESWRDLYYHEDNADFRRQRPDPNKIYPGDIVMIPDRAEPEKPKPKPKPEDKVKIVIAKDGDTLCSIAVKNGFLNCKKLRPLNPDLLTPPLKPGDKVKVPEVAASTNNGETEIEHKFERKGSEHRVWFIQDQNRPKPKEALADKQKELAVSNYVPTRQGAGFTTGDWKDDTFRGDAHDAAASADPDHFKIQVWDDHARKAGETDIKVTLQSQKPVLDASSRIEKWDDMTEGGTKLEDVMCKQVEADSPWYRSSYLRLVIDTADQTMKRPFGRATTGPQANENATVDAGTDVSKQTLVVPTTTDKRIEILDLRTKAHRIYDDCEAPEADRCSAIAMADVGKDEKVLRIKVFRISSAADSGISDATVDAMIFQNYRLTLAQSNVGVELVDGTIHDVALPRNMIAVSDFHGVKSDGGGQMKVKVRLASGDVEVTITTESKKTPQETANRLAAALRAQGVTCRVSPNPPVQSSSRNFGSCDILCFNADNTPARIISRSSADSDQKLASSGSWNTTSVANAGSQYSAITNGGTSAQMVGSIDYRAACKNYNTGTNHLCVILVNGFPSATLLGEALLPYRDLAARIRPRRDYSMCVFINQRASTRRTVLTHEAGHVLLDGFHTTAQNVTRDASNNITFAAEKDNFNNVYDDNSKLGFSEWMAAINRESNPPVIHKRMSDDPLTTKFTVIRKGVNNLQGKYEVIGGAKPSMVKRFRALSTSVLGKLRELKPAPNSGL